LNKTKLIALLLLVAMYQAAAQNLHFTNLGGKDGLPNGLVFSIAQDSKGFVWFGTNGGLARFDGYNFKVYKPNSKTPNTISDKSVHKLFTDSRGNLWMSIQGLGLNRMVLETEKIHYYFPDAANAYALSGNEIKGFIEDNQKRFWVASNKGIDCYDTLNDRFVHCFPKEITAISYPNNLIYAMANSPDHIWFLSGHGIGRFSKSTGQVQSLGMLAAKPELDKLGIQSLVIDKKGNVWFGTEKDGLYCFNVNNNSLTSYLSESDNIRGLYVDKRGSLYVYAHTPNYKFYRIKDAIFLPQNVVEIPIFDKPYDYTNLKFSEDKRGSIYIGTFNGLYIFNPESNKTEHYESNIYIDNTLVNNQIEEVFIDNREVLWLSLFREGIDKADLNQKPFQWYMSIPDNANTQIGSNVIGIYEDRDQNIWLGCFAKGVSSYNPGTKQYKAFPRVADDPSKINDISPTCFCQDDEGFIWVGYADGQLDKINRKTDAVEHYNYSYPVGHPNHFEGWKLRRIVQDSEGNLWFATMNGMIERVKTTGEFIYHSVLYEENYELNLFYRTLYIDNDGIIWGGSQNGGLVKYDRGKKKFTHYRNDPNNKASISSNVVYAIFDSGDGFLYVGTSSGLNKFNKITESFEQKGVEGGLPNYSLYCIFPDKNGNFWMSSDNGLLQYSLANDSFKKYNDNDGLIENEFATTSHFQVKSGDIYLGSPRGMISFNPSQIVENSSPSKPVLTALKVFNVLISPGDSLNHRILLNKQIWATKHIILNANENDFLLEFTSLEYGAPDKAGFYYKLEGYNSNWIHTDYKQRFAAYTGLPHGNYTFRLGTTNPDGLQCRPEDDVILDIEILPPFYKTVWFKLFLLFSLISFVILIIWLREKNFKAANELLEQKVYERTNELEQINVELEERQEEINLQKEELTTQRDSLEEANTILVKQQEKILLQNEEIDKHLNQLEKLVEARTLELEYALRKAEESDRLKSAFLANMSHEIRTPMNAIIGFSELLYDKQLSETERDDYVDIITQNSNSLLVLINDILDLSKIQANEMKLIYSEVPVIELLNSIYESSILEANKKSIGLLLNVKEASSSLLIEADYMRLRQVLINLVSNAIKFTHEGFVEFGVQKIDHQITFYVKDTGVGIADDSKGRIFERFLKLEISKNKFFGGVGLGLAISKNLVELWNGSIWYESEMGKGTTFYFTCPLKVASPHLETDKEITNKSTIPALIGKTILIAEDEEYNYQVLEAYLKKTEATVCWATDGEKVLEFLKTHKPDIILMDIKMPVMNGLEATDQIKILYPDIPIVAQTAYAYQNELDEFSNHGIVDYLIKPIRSEALMILLNKYF
jgi:signal transduction histidine kinase/ligand-binding sensor domain-containing protein/CheY-like chemotaxis protein